MSYVTGEDRGQEYLLPGRIEDYVAANSPVRVIDAFVEQLDLEKLGFLRPPAATGRPGYHPGLLVRHYLYGYLNRIRSSRRLEAEAGRNLELMWLLRRVQPDHWTIAMFRKEHRVRFKGVFRQFNLLCRKLELFGAELVAIDGAKFKAVNSTKRHHTREQLQELVAQIDGRIEAYLAQLDQADDEQAGVADAPSAAELTAKLAQVLDRGGHYEQLLGQLNASGQHEVSVTDPDSRGQKKVGVGYNVQVAVDAKHHLIATETVEQAANDQGQLHVLAAAAKQELGVRQAVADAGYHEAGQLEKCEQAGITTYVPAPGTRSGQVNGGAQVYPKESFRYDAQQDCYHCPAGHSLPRTGAGRKNGKERFYYHNRSACAACALKAQCTTHRYRKLSRLQNEAVVERQAGRVAARPDLVQARKTIVEHVFGTLRMWTHDDFLCRGLEMVRAEFTLSALAYNLRRALNVAGAEKMLASLRPAQ